LTTLCFLNNFFIEGQSPVFYHLSTAEGLPDNNVKCSAIDRNGILWLGTSEGLSSFDGNRIRSFNKYDFPALAVNNVEDIMIDDQNNIWLNTTSNTVTMLDKNRKFHSFRVGDSSSSENVTNILSVSNGIIAINGKGHFICKNGFERGFEKLKWKSTDSLPSRMVFISRFSADTYICYANSRLMLFDYKKMELLLNVPFKNLTGAARVNDDELFLYTNEGNIFYTYSISQKKIIKEFSNLHDQFHKPVEGNFRNVARIDENNFVMTSRFTGLYYFNLVDGSIKNYRHDPLDHRSIGGNNTYRIRYDTSGYLMVSTQTSGLHYYNIRQQQASFKPYFNNSSDIFDGYIQTIFTTTGDIVWMGAQDRIIRWDRKNDRSDFIPCYRMNGMNITGEETIRALHFDNKGNLWVGTTRFGVLILDRNLKTIAQLIPGTDTTKSFIPSGWVNAICADSKGDQWIATLRGVCITRKNSFKVEDFKNHPVLKAISKIHCTHLWVDSQERIWMGSMSGVYCYDEKNNSLKHYTTRNGLSHNTVHAVNEDNNGNIYFGTAGGFSILSRNGSIQSFNRSNGLKNDKCEGILKDEKGFLWIGNLNCIIRYDPSKKKFAVFEEGFGFSHAGFRMRSCYKSQTGEMFWGSDKGLTWFYPNQMNMRYSPLRISINSLQKGDSTYSFTQQQSFKFPFNTSSFTFSFSSGELTGSKKSQVLYRLSGLEDEWKSPDTRGYVVYTRLPPGNYEFQMKSSQDGATWYDAAYPVSFSIGQPWWKQTWFRALSIIFLVIVSSLLFWNYRKRKEEKMARLKTKLEMMELNVKIAESRFSNLRLQMNPHFLFNSLSSIQHLIVSQQTTKAYRYLTLFSNFLRSLLNYADKNFIPLDEMKSSRSSKCISNWNH
jgi:ligand-binding sensor domain-containing protein